MNRDVMKRLEALESREGESVVAFLDRSTDPVTGGTIPVEGWVIVAVTKPWPHPVIDTIWRESGETHDDLEARAQTIGRRHGGVVACYPANSDDV